jgi:GNAT superfamily N-acetyltransferase
MTRKAFGAQPSVLRCSRCGRFVDWEHARLQVVCECRPHIELPPVLVREAAANDREATLVLFERDFGHTNIVAFGEILPIEEAPALVAVMKGELAGALAYRPRDDALQILALATDAMWQRSGVGGYLVAEVELLARRLKLPKILVATSNDNLPSLYFYQRRGYRITEVVRDARVVPGLAAGRGFAGIPAMDEMRLEKLLDRVPG